MITADEILKRVEGYASSELESIVRAALRNNSASVLEGVATEHITDPSLRDDTVALLRVQGTAEVGGTNQSWSVVLKVVEAPGNLSPDIPLSGEREAAAYESGFLDSQFSGVRAASLYSVQRSDGLVWLWIEDLKQLAGPPWTIGNYATAAVGIGQFAGACALELPYDQDWMAVDRIISRWGHDEMRSVLGTSRRAEGPLQSADYLSGKFARDFERIVNGLDLLRPVVKMVNGRWPTAIAMPETCSCLTRIQPRLRSRSSIGRV